MILCFKDGKPQFLPALVVERHLDYSEDLVEIVLQNNNKVLATPEHAMLLGDNLDICYARDVRTGQKFLGNDGIL